MSDQTATVTLDQHGAPIDPEPIGAQVCGRHYVDADHDPTNPRAVHGRSLSSCRLEPGHLGPHSQG